MDYIQQNIDTWNKIPETTKQQFINKDLRNYSGVLHKFVCVTCGKRVSSLICNFFKWNVEVIKCYECQDNNR